MSLVNKIKDIILENNYFDTLAGQKFVEWNDIKHITAVISFSGRSKNRESYKLSSDSESDVVYVTHLYIDRWGNVKVQLGDEDTMTSVQYLHLVMNRLRTTMTTHFVSG